MKCPKCGYEFDEEEEDEEYTKPIRTRRADPELVGYA